VTTTAESLLKDRYALRDLLGEGGMASVYRAFDTSLGREVAVKLFPPNADESEGAKQEDEVNVLAALSHHGLVTLLDAGVDRSTEHGSRVFFVMELVTGADLRRTLEAGPLAARDIALVGYDIAEALQYVHSRDVVHRDIKPSNILFVDYFDDGSRVRAKLTDFGIAHRGIDRSQGDTTTGTAAYLSPEQVAREPIGPASDIYALGLVLLECFTTTLAFPGEPVDSAIARLQQQPSMPSSLLPEWRTILEAMTAREPVDRPTAKDVALAMRQLAVSEMGRHARDSASPVATESTSESAFDRITAIAARVVSAPIAIMSIVDSGREWLLARGIDLAAIEQETGKYSSANLYQAAWIPTDASTDPQVLRDPLVAAQFGLEIYASVPLFVSDGTQIGVLCVLGFEPRQTTEAELTVLEDLARMAMSEFNGQLDEYFERRTAETAETAS
jgi:serine/threonine protein kinase